MLWLGVDVGGTFTDLVLFDLAAGKLQVLKTPSTPRNQSEGILAGISRLGVDASEARADGARHHGGNQHGARARRRAPRRPGDRRPQGRAGGGARQPHGHVQHQGAADASAGAAVAMHRGAREAARRRVGGDAARRGRRWMRSPSGSLAKASRRWPSASCTPTPIRSTSSDARRMVAKRLPAATVTTSARGAARVPGVRALLDHRAQRLRGAAHAPLSRRPAQQAVRRPACRRRWRS